MARKLLLLSVVLDDTFENTLLDQAREAISHFGEHLIDNPDWPKGLLDVPEGATLYNCSVGFEVEPKRDGS
jgi:hypothetical protein